MADIRKAFTANAPLLFASPRTRTTLFVSVAVAAWLGLCLAFSPFGEHVQMFGFGILGMSVPILAVGLIIRKPDERCSFCLRTRRDVQQLIAGTAVAVCDDCLGLCLGVLQSVNMGWLKQVLRALPTMTPVRVTGGGYRDA